VISITGLTVVCRRENKMKEIIAKTSSAKEIAVPWFETMGKQVGLSKRTTAAILRNNSCGYVSLTGYLHGFCLMPSKRGALVGG
jgi:hypothetical protein